MSMTQSLQERFLSEVSDSETLKLSDLETLKFSDSETLKLSGLQ